MAFFLKAALSMFGRSSSVKIVTSIKESLIAVETKTIGKALKEESILILRQTLVGIEEVKTNQDKILQIALEICKPDVLSLSVYNLPSLREHLEARRALVDCWGVLLFQQCCLSYLENHHEIIDFLFAM